MNAPKASADMAPTNHKVGEGLTVHGWCITGHHCDPREAENYTHHTDTLKPCTCWCHKEEP